MQGSKQHSRSATKLVDHIRELQKRLLIAVVALVISGIAVYFVYEPLLNLLRAPLGAPLFYSTPAGSFAFVMKICFMGALVVTIPVIIYNLIMFIRPAFQKHIPLRSILTVSFLSALLAFAGTAFGYYYIIPGALRFFAGFQVDGLSALISADSYLGFVTNVIITFVIVFQIPLLIAFIDRIKPLSPKKLLAGEKWVVLASLCVSVLVPFAFDLTTSLLIALPIVVLYNISIVIVLMQHAAARRKEKALMPRFNLAAMPVSQLSLDALSFEDLVGHEPIAEVTPAYTPLVAPSVNLQQPGSMDIRRVNQPQATVLPPSWVNRVHDPIPLNPRARLVSF